MSTLRFASAGVPASSFWRLRSDGSFTGVTPIWPEPVLRLGEIELRLVLLVEGGDVRVGDRDLGGDVALEQLLNRQLLPMVSRTSSGSVRAG